MRILHVVHSLVPGEYRGGISKVAHELAAAQVRLGHQVDVYTTTLNSGVPTDIPPGHRATVDGIQCTYFAADPQHPTRTHAPTLKQALLEQAGQYDVLHGHNPLSCLSGYLAAAARRSRRPLFHHLHGALNPYGQQSWYRFARRELYVRLVERRNLHGNRALFCLSPHEAHHAERQVRAHNTHVLPNGTTLFDACHNAQPTAFREKHQLQEATILLFMGRICDIKGVHLLAEAFARLATENPRLHLVIAGNREQFPGYTARIDQQLAVAGLTGRVTWTGFLNDHGKIDALAAADLFCHPSETEGMPMAVLEAMAMKLPCVIGKGCFMAQAAAAGAVVECEFTTDSVETQLRQCLDSRDLRERLAAIAGRHVREFHTWDAIAEQTIACYGNRDVVRSAA